MFNDIKNEEDNFLKDKTPFQLNDEEEIIEDFSEEYYEKLMRL